MQLAIPSIPPSGYHYSNNIGRIYLQSIRDLLGGPTYAEMLTDIGLHQYIRDLPPNNFEKHFEFAHFSMLTAALEQLQAVNPRNPSLPVEAGRRCFKDALKSFGALAGFSQQSLALQVFPLNIKLKLGLQAMAITFNTFSDQRTEVDEQPDSYVYRILRCPVCWGRHADQPTCIMATGLLAAGLHWITDREYHITETECCAVGAQACTLVIDKTPLPE